MTSFLIEVKQMKHASAVISEGFDLDYNEILFATDLIWDFFQR